MASQVLEAPIVPEPAKAVLAVEHKSSTPPLNDDGLDRKTLFVRSIPLEATDEELSQFFSQFVPVKHAVTVKDENQKSRGFGFVSFTMDEDTTIALQEAKKAKFKNRLLRVDIAKRRDRKSRDAKNTSPGSTTRDTKGSQKISEPVEKRRARLIIRNLPWSCKKPDELKKIFSQYGAVFDAYIPKKKGGKMCGFAFVVMKKLAAAERAVKGLVGLKIDGREVAVDLALEKSKWEETKDQNPESDEDEVDDDDDVKDEEEVTTREGNSDGENGSEPDDEVEAEEFEKLNEINSDDEVEEGQDELLSDSEHAHEEEDRPKSNRQEAFSLFIRNIPYDADAESLKEHFERFGPVKYALPVIDRETGLAKGSAFVAFSKQEPYEECIKNAPTSDAASMLIADDVSRDYVYQGRILSITPAVDRHSAEKLAERNTHLRNDRLGKGPGPSDKRNLFLLNEGRITSNSKLAQFISKTDLEMRDKSYKLRVQQLNKNPSLHLSFTRLAIRNLPRAMNPKALKALGRKAVVQFATEVTEGARQPLSKEEINRSIKHKHDTNEFLKKGDENKKKNKLMGVVKQAKVVLEVKGSGETGRSRGYGFLEFRDHKSALMGLRWLNAHEVSLEEITEGLNDEEKKLAQLEGLSKRRLIAEFAIENAEVVKRRRDRVFIARNPSVAKGEQADGKTRKRKTDTDDNQGPPAKRGRKGSLKKGNMNKGNAGKDKNGDSKPMEKSSGLSDDTKKLIGMKRKRRKNKA